MTTINAAVAYGKNEPLRVEELQLEQPKAGELLVRIAASGVCHSDLSMVNGTLPSAYPIVLGHEGAGVIEAIGEGVTDFAVGDHVVISWVPQCGTCYFCTRGQAFLCTASGKTRGSGGLLDGTTRLSKGDEPVRQMLCTGTFAERVVIPEIGAVKVDKEVPLEVAALVGCAVLTGVGAAVNTAEIRPGDTVVVLGCGGIGLNVIQGAKIQGAERIIAVDAVATKLDTARQFGATDVIDASSADTKQVVMELTKNRGVDVVFEAIGLPATMQQAVDLARRGGQIVLVGIPKPGANIDLAMVVFMVKTIKGCWYGSADIRRDVPRIIDWYRNGQLKLDELISQRITLHDIDDAFRAMERGEVARSVISF